MKFLNVTRLYLKNHENRRTIFTHCTKKSTNLNECLFGAFMKFNFMKFHVRKRHEVEAIEDVPSHEPVMIKETLDALRISPEGTYLDLTFGSGGHTRALLQHDPTIRVFGLDRDPEVKEEFADHVEKDFDGRFTFMQGKFSDLPELAEKHNFGNASFNGILMDLGVSSMQFDRPQRGFMLSRNGPLDMRMGGHSDDTPTAADFLATLNEQSLARVIKYFGGERRAKAVAKVIVEARGEIGRMKTTQELREVIEAALGEGGTGTVDGQGRFIHPATKTFQAIRILVNDELNQLDFAIRASHALLRPGGRLVALSFQALEDAILKRHFMGVNLDPTPETLGMSMHKHIRSIGSYDQEAFETRVSKPWQNVFKHVVSPTRDEVTRNARSRSAKMRVAYKLIESHY